MAVGTVTLKTYTENSKPDTWCPGCGHFGVKRAMQKAMVDLGLAPHEVVAVTGIGCSGKFNYYFGSNGFNSMHGRSLPVAQAIKIANRNLTVIAAGGDGDGYGIGIGHFTHACRRNVDITYVVMDNHIYGLTTGQTSPTSEKGFVTSTTPYGAAEYPIRPLELALAAGCGFVAQGFSGNQKQLARLFAEAIQHKGFSLINVYSPCVTYNGDQTYEFYRESLTDLDEKPDYQPNDRQAAFKLVHETAGLVNGLIFKEERRDYQEELPNYYPGNLVEQDPSEPLRDRAELLAAFK
ncbi:MAG TPA: 2-oxoacid:ferredoxin oxidoreductase subunit beta [Limnochordia bacterium]|nr:2-oxoacid:ferredoxin oxidoreductase subunit beta [Limnochordia bacterium]